MKTILVTGANRGIGLEICEQGLKRGYRILATCRKPEAADDLKDLEEDTAGQLTLLPLDVSHQASVDALRDHLVENEVRLDWLVNNAGICVFEKLADVDEDVMSAIHRTNVTGPLLVTRAMRPFLAGAERPLVVMISSRAGSIGWMSGTDLHGYAYCTSKAALNMVTVQLSKELKDDGIIVISQSPGWVRTEMGGDQAPLSVEDSVNGMLPVWERVTLADSGKFFAESGDAMETIPW